MFKFAILLLLAISWTSSSSSTVYGDVVSSCGIANCGCDASKTIVKHIKTITTTETVQTITCGSDDSDDVIETTTSETYHTGSHAPPSQDPLTTTPNKIETTTTTKTTPKTTTTTTTGSISLDPTDYCKTVTKNGFYPNLSDASCATYLYCDSGVGTMGYCPLGQYFDPKKLICTGKMPAGCEAQS